MTLSEFMAKYEIGRGVDIATQNTWLQANVRSEEPLTPIDLHLYPHKVPRLTYEKLEKMFTAIAELAFQALDDLKKVDLDAR